MAVQVVWFKRDLRVQDHAPLAEAAERGPVLPLYVAEPGLWREPDASGRQFASLREALSELREDLAALGQPLIVRVGDAIDILAEIQGNHGIEALWSHQETGNGWTYARDRAVLAWCRAHGVPWHEFPQFGVIRGLRSRAGWARRWDRRMASPVMSAPAALAPVPGCEAGGMPEASDLALLPDPCPGRFPGGRSAALVELRSFLNQRGEPYQKAMSGPATAFDACSRLSAHISHGTVSLREIFQAARARQRALEDLPPAKRGAWPGALRSFLARLHWHCHFMQKLEDEPALEFRDLHPAYAGLRRPDPERLERWAKGETGLPFVDACVRALIHHGWINFRMRAMLVAVASYQLWLPWRDTGLPLARLFTDYEPGIHWPQMQMQSATTGINLPRIYNPIKQGRDFDPGNAFIRRWVPELASVPAIYVHEPWTWPQARKVLTRRYASPLVEERAARREAQERIWAVRRTPGYGETADAIQDRHGSRKSGMPQQARRARGAASQPEGRQLTLALGENSWLPLSRAPGSG